MDSKEKHTFNGNVICYIDRNKEVHSIEDDGVLIAEDGFFGQNALVKRNELNTARKKELRDAEQRMKAALKEEMRKINKKFDERIATIKHESTAAAYAPLSDRDASSISASAIPGTETNSSNPKNGQRQQSQTRLIPKPGLATTEVSSFVSG